MTLPFIRLFRQTFVLRAKNQTTATFSGFNRNFNSTAKELPHLPVPKLEDTLTKYLRTAKPLVTEEEFSVTKQLVSEFIAPGGTGKKLQQCLQERAKCKENWLSEWWLSTAYLDYRWPVVVWSSPGLVFPLETFKTLDDQLTYAAKVISGALDYKVRIDENSLPVDKMGNDILDMSQYFKIFGTCRIPGVANDSIQYYGQSDDPPSHIAVVHNNHFFRVDVYGKMRKPLNWKQIYQQLRGCIERSTHATSPVGILSTQNRNVWGKAYKKLMKDKLNRSSMEDIQRSLFIVCIDGPIKNSTGNRLTNAALQCIHGNGWHENSGNRWFDKTLQFIIGKKGEVGITYEHSPAEGPPIANLMDHIINYISSSHEVYQLPAVELSRPKRLMFNLTSDILSEIDDAKVALESLVSDLDMTCFKFSAFGKNYIKDQRMSPDSFIQIAIQFAFYRLHSEAGAQYESASTRKYLHGRTETIRSCSEEAVTFSRLMLNPESSNSMKAAALRDAVTAHKAYAADAVNGYGVDRHLLGLKQVAIETGRDVPPLFMDVSYIRSSHMRLSTSQVPAKCEAFMCYGPLVPDGYGCCYNPQSDSIMFGLSAFNSSPQTSSASFKDSLECSLHEMQGVLIKEAHKAKL